MTTIDIVDLGIAEMLEALDSGRITSVQLVCAYLNRIAYYDRTGICLGSVPVIARDCLSEATRSDERRRAGHAGPLEGVPFTVKDSYKVRGMPVAAGSPALTGLVATEDAASVAALRAAGAVLLGRTTMPPMAAGGIQPGVNGWPRSPYHPDYLTAAYGSGSSSGSGTATAASLCAFGMGEETVSSGRSPASNNALVSYTPSRGVLSLRGNWPLRPTCDVIVPQTRCVDDLLRLLDVLAVTDPNPAGDFWREQHAVDLPAPERVLPSPTGRKRPRRLDGLRIGVPRMYIGEATGLHTPPVIRPSVRRLWDRAARDLRDLGAEVVPVDLPVVTNYEEDGPDPHGLPERGLVPPDWRAIEGDELTAMALDGFLRQNADPHLHSWADVDGDAVFPLEDEPVPVWITSAHGGFDWQRLAELVKAGLPGRYDDVPGLPRLLRGLEEARRVDLEVWLDRNGIDLLAFPAAGDVGRTDLFQRPESLEQACRNGVVYSNGNRVIRHLGIPTVTVPMGLMDDIQMPVGVTFAGPAYTDDRLLDVAAAYEAATLRRRPAFLTPSLPSSRLTVSDAAVPVRAAADPTPLEMRVEPDGRFWRVSVRLDAAVATQTRVWADGILLRPEPQHPDVFIGGVSRRRPRIAPEIMLVTLAGQTAGSLDWIPLP